MTDVQPRIEARPAPPEGSSPKGPTAWLVPFACLIGSGALLGISTNLAKLAAEAGLQPLLFLAWSVTGSALSTIGVGFQWA